MKIPRIAKAMEYIDDDLVSGAVNTTTSKRNPAWAKWGAVAACLCLVIIGTIIWKHASPSNSTQNGITISENGVTIPQMDVSLSANASAEADMIGFFIYQGRCYVQYEWIYDETDIVGEYLGTATGLIDEWTSKEGYVELAGSVKGDFYAVNGYDPSFMLCMKDAAGAVSTYICNTGITLKYGSELYEERLHLSDNFETVQYESRVSWYYSKNERYQINSINDIMLDFIKKMNSAEFVPCDSVPLDEGQTTITDTELYHLYFQMKNGTTIHLRLHENGYVRFQGISSLCVQVSEECYNALLELLDNHIDATAVDVEVTGTTLEDCLTNAEFGEYVPSYIPEDMFFDSAEIYSYQNSQESSEVGTKEMWLYYSCIKNPYKFYSITITWAKEYGNNGWAGPMIEAADLNVELISEYIEPETASGKPSKLDIGVWYDDIAVVISARGVDAEIAFEILNSIKI